MIGASLGHRTARERNPQAAGSAGSPQLAGDRCRRPRRPGVGWSPCSRRIAAVARRSSLLAVASRLRRTRGDGLVDVAARRSRESVERVRSARHRVRPGHRGIDLPGSVGEPVRAVAAGRVTFAGPGGGRRRRHGRPRARAIDLPAGRAAGRRSATPSRAGERDRHAARLAESTARLRACTSVAWSARTTSTRSSCSASARFRLIDPDGQAAGAARRRRRSRTCNVRSAGPSRRRSACGSIPSRASASCTTAPTSASRAARRSTRLRPAPWSRRSMQRRLRQPRRHPSSTRASRRPTTT